MTKKRGKKKEPVSGEFQFGSFTNLVHFFEVPYKRAIDFEHCFNNLVGGEIGKDLTSGVSTLCMAWVLNVADILSL